MSPSNGNALPARLRTARAWLASAIMVVLAVPLALFILFDREARKTLATPGPYVAAAAALITMSPHLVWLARNDFLPFSYAEHRAPLSGGLVDHDVCSEADWIVQDSTARDGI